MLEAASKKGVKNQTIWPEIESRICQKRRAQSPPNFKPHSSSQSGPESWCRGQIELVLSELECLNDPGWGHFL